MAEWPLKKDVSPMPGSHEDLNIQGVGRFLQDGEGAKHGPHNRAILAELWISRYHVMNSEDAWGFVGSTRCSSMSQSGGSRQLSSDLLLPADSSKWCGPILHLRYGMAVGCCFHSKALV